MVTLRRIKKIRVITSGCNTAVENLSIFVENVLIELARELPSQIKDTCHMLDIIDDMNNSNLSSNAILVSFDIVNMFPSIDNNMGIASVRKYLDERECKDLPTDCVIEALELCLSCNNSVFNNTNYLQTDGTAQGPLQTELRDLCKLTVQLRDLICLALMQI